MHELTYVNNPHSLFRKYSQLVTWFATTRLGKEYLGIPDTDILLLTPNGFHSLQSVQKEQVSIQAVFYTKAIYAAKLYPALVYLDIMQSFLKDFTEAKQVFLWNLGLATRMPDIVRAFHLSTLVVNPDASVETTTTDGIVGRAGVDEAFSTIRSGAGTQSDHTGTGGSGVGVRMLSTASATTTHNLAELDRIVTLFDTSSLTTSAVINSATYSLYPISRNISAINFNTDIVQVIPGSNTTLVNSDFNIANWTMALQSDTETPVNSFTMSAYNDFPLNATGLANVSKTGITKFGCVSNYDMSNTNPNYAGNSQDDRFSPNFADAGSNKPKLTVNYGIAYTKALSDTLSPADTLARFTTKVLTSSISPTDTIIRKTTKSPVDTISPSELFFIGYIRFKTLLDTLTPIENYFMRFNGGFVRWVKIAKAKLQSG